MRYHVLTLFPGMVEQGLHTSVIGRAMDQGLISLECINIRDYAGNKHMKVDDYPYGGGAGMVMQAEPVYCAYQAAVEKIGYRPRVIYVTPQGHVFHQRMAEEFAKEKDMIFLCGHYEGVDERVLEEIVTDYVSIGDYVLTGGETAALVVIDAVSRLLPGVLGSEESAEDESFTTGLLEYPQYTRPEVWEGRAVPGELLTGDHALVARWRRKKQLERTMDKRPDMFEKLQLTSKEDKRLVEEIKYERLPEKMKLKFEPRRSTNEDVPGIMGIVRQAQRYLRESGIDQWQDGYPNEAVLYSDVESGRGWVFECGGELAGYVCISMDVEASYAQIEGRWLTEGDNYAVVHRSMVGDKYRGSRLATEMFSLAFDLAAGLGKASVRVDTHRDNKAMNRLAQKLGFTYCGEVDVSLMDPCRDPKRNAYEKLV